MTVAQEACREVFFAGLFMLLLLFVSYWILKFGTFIWNKIQKLYLERRLKNEQKY